MVPLILPEGTGMSCSVLISKPASHDGSDTAATCSMTRSGSSTFVIITRAETAMGGLHWWSVSAVRKSRPSFRPPVLRLRSNWPTHRSNKYIHILNGSATAGIMYSGSWPSIVTYHCGANAPVVWFFAVM